MENHHVGNYISASMLAGGGCARQTVLERHSDFYEIPHRRFWSFRGTHAHSMIERAEGLIDKFGWICEMRMMTKLAYDLPLPLFDNGVFTGDFDHEQQLEIEIGGTLDSYNPLTRELWDLKSMADVKAEMMITGSKPGTYSPHLDDAWVKQLNIYRWLVSRTPLTREVKKKFKLTGKFLPAPETLGIQGISMMNIPRTGAKYAFRKGRGVTLLDIEAVPVWDLEQTEAFVREEALKWYRWLVLRQPTDVVPASKKWLCDSCAFNGERFNDGICFPDAERKNARDLQLEE